MTLDTSRVNASEYERFQTQHTSKEQQNWALHIKFAFDMFVLFTVSHLIALDYMHIITDLFY